LWKAKREWGRVAKGASLRNVPEVSGSPLSLPTPVPALVQSCIPLFCEDAPQHQSATLCLEGTSRQSCCSLFHHLCFLWCCIRSFARIHYAAYYPAHMTARMQMCHTAPAPAAPSDAGLRCAAEPRQPTSRKEELSVFALKLQEYSNDEPEPLPDLTNSPAVVPVPAWDTGNKTNRGCLLSPQLRKNRGGQTRLEHLLLTGLRVPAGA